MKGRFVLSDDSHGTGHIGTNYAKALQFLKKTGISEIYYFEKTSGDSNGRLNDTVARGITMSDLESHKYWSLVE